MAIKFFDFFFLKIKTIAVALNLEDRNSNISYDAIFGHNAKDPLFPTPFYLVMMHKLIKAGCKRFHGSKDI